MFVIRVCSSRFGGILGFRIYVRDAVKDFGAPEFENMLKLLITEMSGLRAGEL